MLTGLRSLRVLSLVILITIGFASFSAAPVFALGESCEEVSSQEMIDGPNVTFLASVQMQAGETFVVAVKSEGEWQVRWAVLVTFDPLAWQTLYTSGLRTGGSQLRFTVPEDGYYGMAVDAFNDVTTVKFACYQADDPDVPGDSPNPGPTWEGEAGSPTYDGRIDASMADRYAVYCSNGELQVWDGANNLKVGSMAYADIELLDNPASVPIGENVYLGRSNNVLGVVIPGEYENLNIALDACIGGDYDNTH